MSADAPARPGPRTGPRAGRPAPERLARDRYAALVVGSGFGGAVCAARLAQGGIDVAVVERGRRWRPGDFPRDLSRLDDGWLWACDRGLYDARPGGDILAICAAGYGGGSLVYANVIARPSAEVFDERWPGAYTRAALDPYFDLVAHMLGVAPVQPDPASGELPPKTQLFARAAAALGAEHGFFRPNLAVTFGDPSVPVTNAFGRRQTGCSFCGECDVGCNTGAKNTLDLNYLAAAEDAGADIATMTEVVHLRRLAAGGYRVLLRELGEGHEATEREVEAERVFLCAGAIGTTELLLRCRDQYATLPDLSPALGHGYSGNGDYLGFVRDTAEPAEPSVGPTITTATVMRAAGTSRDQWFMVQDGGYSQHLARLVEGLDVARLPTEAVRGLGTAARQAIAAVRGIGAQLSTGVAGTTAGARTVVLLVMGRDRADGRMELVGPHHRLKVRWDTVLNDPLYAAERAASADTARVLGGRPLAMPTWRLFRQPVTVHNLGGSRMSTDPAAGVTDPDGEVWGYPGLYVLDGSVLPGSTGANPSMTIAAVAERCIERVVRRVGQDPHWTAPERDGLQPVAAPEDAAIEAVRVQPAVRPSPGVGLAFRERMRGNVGAPVAGRVVPQYAEVRLGVRIEDLTLFLADPLHAARLEGEVFVAGLTRAPVPVLDGSLHLLAPAEGRARTMDYLMPFTADDGRRWALRGTKEVRREGRHGPWYATTRLRTRLTAPDEVWSASTTSGLMTLGPVEVTRMLTTLRPLVRPGTQPEDRVRTFARFGTFFAREVLGATLPRRA